MKIKEVGNVKIADDLIRRSIGLIVMTVRWVGIVFACAIFAGSTSAQSPNRIDTDSFYIRVDELPRASTEELLEFLYQRNIGLGVLALSSVELGFRILEKECPALREFYTREDVPQAITKYFRSFDMARFDSVRTKADLKILNDGSSIVIWQYRFVEELVMWPPVARLFSQNDWCSVLNVIEIGYEHGRKIHRPWRNEFFAEVFLRAGCMVLPVEDRDAVDAIREHFGENWESEMRQAARECLGR